MRIQQEAPDGRAGSTHCRQSRRLTDYTCNLNYESLSPEPICATKVRVIDTLAALMAGFFSEPSAIARNLAAQSSDPNGATVIGCRMKTTTEIAAFANGTAARYAELNDFCSRDPTFVC